MPQPRKTSPNRFYVSGHDVFLYRRKESSFWWAGFHSDGSIIRTSTKAITKTNAISFAKDWYYKKRGEIDNGIYLIKKNAFEKVASLAIEDYQKRIDRKERSQNTLDNLKIVLGSKVLPFFANIDIKKVNNQTWQQFKKEIATEQPQLSHGTYHQYKNSIRVVLNYAFQNNLINVLPEFKDVYQSSSDVKPRPPFNAKEYNQLHRAIKKYADNYLKTNKLFLYNETMELYDFVIFGTNTGMRVEELMSMKFSDISVVEEVINGEKNKILLIINIRGKSGQGSCKSYIGAYSAFNRIIKRRNIKEPEKSDEKVFLIKHRVLFNKILGQENLKLANTNPPRKRDFVSLRSTYITFRLLSGVSAQDIAFNCRNSIEVIQKNYAKDLGGILLKDINKTRLTKLIWED